MIQGVQLFSSVIILREEWRIYRRLWTKVWVRVRGRAGVLCVARYRRSSAHTHTPPLNSFFPRCACARDASVLSARCAGVVPRGVFCAFMRTCVFPRHLLRIARTCVCNSAYPRSSCWLVRIARTCCQLCLASK
jgi:hypothetical protein